MTNQFTHSLAWPDAKAKIIENLQGLEAKFDHLIKFYPDRADDVRDTRAQFQRIAKLTGL